MQDFETPPKKIPADQNAEGDLDQLDDQFVFAHQDSACCCDSDCPETTYNGTAPALISSAPPCGT
jgi:hypothetical protein